jgi:hypothetical protein
MVNYSLFTTHYFDNVRLDTCSIRSVTQTRFTRAGSIDEVFNHQFCSLFGR